MTAYMTPDWATAPASLEPTAELWCDRCLDARCQARTDDVAELRRLAAVEGWSSSPGYADTGDLCPACVAARVDQLLADT